MVRAAVKRKGYYVVVTVFFCALGLLLLLGAWQLNRGLEKKKLENILSNRGEQYTEISAKPETWEGLNHQRVQLKGQWRWDKTFLMDNRVYQSRLGYEVYSPFELAGDQAVLLVNRGWLDVEQRDRAESDTGKADEINIIKGHLYLPQSGFTLGEAIANQSHWPKVIQYFDAGQLSVALSKPLEPAVLVLDSDQKVAYTRIWQPYVMNSARHFGYAVQWWALALTLGIFGIIWRKQSLNRK